MGSVFLGGEDRRRLQGGRQIFHPPCFSLITQGRDCKNTNIFSPGAERCFWTQKVGHDAAEWTGHTVVSFIDTDVSSRRHVS